MWWETKVGHWNKEVTGSDLGTLRKPVQPKETAKVGRPHLSLPTGGDLC